MPPARRGLGKKRLQWGGNLSPAVAGSWVWATDKVLRFTPKTDWPVDGDFSIRLARRGFFAQGVELEEYKIGFRGPAFTAIVSESQFYQDPRNPNLKKLVATVQFSHPVDTKDFE